MGAENSVLLKGGRPAQKGKIVRFAAEGQRFRPQRPGNGHPRPGKGVRAAAGQQRRQLHHRVGPA